MKTKEVFRVGTSLTKQRKQRRLHWTKGLLTGYVAALLSVIGFGLFFTNVVLADPPAVTLGTSLTKVTDGTAPFPSVDPNGTNGLVATLDSARYTFDVSINPIDGVPGTVTGLTIVGTLDTATADVTWMRNSANIAEISDVCNTRTVSVDGKTMTCVVNGPIATSTTLNIQAAWFALSSAPNGTDVDVSFTANATDPSAADNPLESASTTDTLTVVSSGSAQYEVRKVRGSTRVESSQRDPSTGVPLNVDVDWHMQVEVVPQSGTTMKGVSTVDLGDLSLTDNLESPDDTDQLPLSTLGTLVSCGGATGAYVAASSGSNSNDNVEDSGSWTCDQPGGEGTNVSVAATGINWAPRWYPDRFGPANSPLGISDTYFRFGVTGTANDQYGSPSGQNNRAVVATQKMTIRYPYEDVKDFDQTAGDQSSIVNTISWCNELIDVDVVGAPDGIDDQANNVACTPAFSTNTGPGVDTAKGFLKGSGTTLLTRDVPGHDIGLKRGVYGPSAQEHYVQPGQSFRMRYAAANSADSVEGLSNVVACDSIEIDQFRLRAHSATTMTGYTTGGSHGYYSWHSKAGASGFPAITDSDVVVEFANAGSLTTNNDQRTVDCDDGGLVWESDPTLVSGGIGSANLMRTRIINDKQIAPGGEIMTVVSAIADSDLLPGDKLRNFSQYKYDVGSTVGTYIRADSGCDLESDSWTGVWNPTLPSSNCRYLGDRLYVLGAAGHLQVRDVGDVNPNDWVTSKAIGSNWTYTMYAGATNMVDTNIEGVEVFQLIEPGSEYVSSTLTPDQIVQDCNANINPSCISNPAARTNYGYTTLKWELGDFELTNSTPGTANTDYTAFGQWNVTVKISPFIANGSTVANRGWMNATGLENLDLPITFPTCPTANDLDTLSGPSDEDCVTVTNPNVFAIEKYVVEDQTPFNDRQAEVELDGVVKYNLAYANTAGTAKVMDAIDVLPYNGDGRFPASEIDGGYSVTTAEGTINPGLLNSVYITDVDPSSLSSDPQDGSNTSPGAAGRWLCTFAERGSLGCPAADAITGLRFISNSITSGQYGYIRVELTTNNNDGQELYTNNFQARATGMVQSVISSDVTATTPSCLSVGNLVFKDTNSNGLYDGSDTGFADVEVELVNADDDIVYKTAVTDGDGRWYINCIAPGEYYARLPESNYANGAPLSGYVPTVGGSSAPQGDDETDSQDLFDQDGVNRTNVFTVDYQTGPLDEFGENYGQDADDDLTIDLGLVLASITDTPSDPTPQSVTPSSSDNSGLLSITGVQFMSGIASLVLATSAYLLITRRVLSKTRTVYQYNKRL